jgi:outer membrane protein insertion porin family
MRTRRALAAFFALGALAALGALGALAPPAGAQVEVDERTQVRSIRFEGVASVPERALRDALRTRPFGPLHGLQKALGALPIVPGPAHRPFSPLELQKDVVRMRRVYAQSGFVEAKIRYDVTHDEEKNLLDVTFVVDEGRALTLSKFRVVPNDSVGPLPVPPGEEASWEALASSIQELEGKRLDIPKARATARELSQWWHDRGFPRARLRPRVERDTVAFTVGVGLEVLPGRPARFGEIRVVGTDHLSEDAVLRQIGFAAGDRYSAAELEDAEVGVRNLQIVRFVDADVPALETRDSTQAAPTAPLPAARRDSVDVLPVRVLVTESKERFLSGQVGYVTDGGLAAQSSWEHYNFTGGGRFFTLAGIAQTGWLAPAGRADRRLRFAASLEQPGFVTRRTSGVLSPFFEMRDDDRDRSNQLGLNATVIHRLRPLRSISLDYQIARRHVLSYHTALASGDLDLFSLFGVPSEDVIDSLASNLNTSTVTLSAVHGSLDDAANPRRGFVIRPAIQTTFPAALSSVGYRRVDATAHGFVPLGRKFTLATRVSYGRLFPHGKSVPREGENPLAQFLELRDASFTAGGAGDVRGWAYRLLGPKVPDVRFDPVADSLVLRTNGYDPLGGLGRATFSGELQMPFPGFGPRVGTHVFFEGGRVWTNDTRYFPRPDPLDQQKLFLATGAGIDLRTPVGPLKFDMGYKLNPSVVDLVAADQMLRVLTGEIPLDQAPRKNSRRWQWNLAVGVSF